MKLLFKPGVMFLIIMGCAQVLLANEQVMQQLSSKLSNRNNSNSSCTGSDGNTYDIHIEAESSKGKARVSMEYVGSYSGIHLESFDYREHRVTTATSAANKITVVFKHKYNNETYKDIYAFDNGGNLLSVEKQILKKGFFGGESYKKEFGCQL